MEKREPLVEADTEGRRTAAQLAPALPKPAHISPELRSRYGGNQDVIICVAGRVGEPSIVAASNRRPGELVCSSPHDVEGVLALDKCQPAAMGQEKRTPVLMICEIAVAARIGALAALCAYRRNVESPDLC